MKTNHRIRRSTKQPQPGSPGAPFLGVFLAEWTSFDPQGGTATLTALALIGNNWVPDTGVWLPNSEIDIAGFQAIDWNTGDEQSIISATVDGTGGQIDVVFTANPETSIIASPGHHATVSRSGILCGGAFVGS